jgi:hypothetical protein
VDKLDVVDQFQLVEKNGAYQSIKVAAGYQTEFARAHGGILNMLQTASS